MAFKVDREIEEYRNLMEVPTEFEDGFGLKSILGVLFVAFVMVPASMYLGLLTGGGLGGGVVEWVTVILFAEVAKRSFTTLRRQEIYVLFYVIGSMMGSQGLFGGYIFNQYLVRSPMAENFGIADKIPRWVVPPADSAAIAARTFLHRDWLVPILLTVLFMVLARFNMLGGGYVLFRITSDREKLPFPFAPMGALGIMALADSTQKKDTWRWRMFSVGAIIGMLFGIIYAGIPAVTGAMLPKPVTLLPIPFIDLTTSFESVMPATPIMFTVDLWAFISGSMLPFWSVMGMLASGLTMLFVNPFVLHNVGFLPTWERGMGAIETMMSNNVDFYMSYGIGVQLAVALIGLYTAVSSVAAAIRNRRKLSGPAPEARRGPPPGRGDYSIKLAIALFLVSASIYVYVANRMVPDFPLIILIIFAFGVSPVQSYVDARLIGLVGRAAPLPMVREGTFLLSGYKGIDIWYMPWPMINMGYEPQFFRIVELTGTKITSIVKAEIFLVPLVFATSFMFWSLIWKLAPIPSPTYPYVQKMWPLDAMNACLWPTATLGKGMLVVAGTGADKAAYEYDEMRSHWVKQTGPDNVVRPGSVHQTGLDSKGNRWFPTDQGLAQFDTKNWTLYTDKTVKRYDRAHSVWVDSDTPTGLPSSRVLCVAIQERTYVWFGTDNGVARFDGKRQWTTWRPEEGLAGSQITCLRVDKDGHAWAGSPSGLSFFDGSRWTAYTTEAGLLSNQITAITTDSTNNAWVGTPMGLHCISLLGDIATFTTASTEGGLVSDHINSVALERVPLAEKGKEKDAIWVATDKGLSRWDGEKWQVFDKSKIKELPSDVVTGIAVEPSTREGAGVKWFSTAGGVVRYDEVRKRGKLFDAASGLPSGPVDHIVLSAGKRYLIEALRPGVIGAGLGIALCAFTLFSLLNLPILLIYGYIGGIAGASLSVMSFPMMTAGAFAGRYYFCKKYGTKEWRQYAMVMSAGYGCGNGLVAMFGVAVALIAKSISQLPF